MLWNLASLHLGHVFLPLIQRPVDEGVKRGIIMASPLWVSERQSSLRAFRAYEEVPIQNSSGYPMGRHYHSDT
jgi:hypothetical protein